MYSYEERMRAVQLLIQYDCSPTAVIHELGYPSRGMLYNWYREYQRTGSLRGDDMLRKTKYSKEQRSQAVKYYLEHGRSYSRTIKALGFPRRTVLREWIDEDIPDDKRTQRCKTNSCLIGYTPEQKEQAVIDYCAGDKSSKEIAKAYGVSPNAVYGWKKQLLGEENILNMKKRKETARHVTAVDESEEIVKILTEKERLQTQVKELERDVYRLQLERDILEKAGEILKKDQGINLQTLTNQEKAILIDALRKNYRLKELLDVMEMGKSSYCYQERALHSPDKYAALRSAVKELFIEARQCYGYRRIHGAIRKKGTRVSEKVIRRIMKEEQLSVSSPKKRKYNSYMGEIGSEVENIINRDFSADAPNSKWLTDITEFSISAGKVYLSPIIDCFDGMAVSWTIGTSPDAELVNSMLDAAIPILAEGEHPVIHSDRGGHYRWPGWIERADKAQLTRSMSKKGCSPDNAACEGFFGRLKNEMFYGFSWIGVSLDDFINALDAYMRWYNEKRIKMSLGAMSPVEYRKSLGLFAFT